MWYCRIYRNQAGTTDLLEGHLSGNCSRSGSGAVESEVVGVHNGIIENYRELKGKLLKHGYTFYSQTDTEMANKLVDYYYKKYKLSPIDAIAKTMVRIRVPMHWN